MQQQRLPVATNDSGPASEARNPGRFSPMDMVIGVTLLFSLAIAQPLLELLGRNAEFFIARDSPTVDIVALALGLTVVVPMALAGAAVLARHVNLRLGDIVFACIFVVLAATLGLLLLRRIPINILNGWAQVATAIAMSVGLFVLYERSEALRRFARWGLVVPVLVLGLFLFTSAVPDLIFGNPASADAAADIADPPPIVFLIFDALPVSSLMDGHGELQDDLYPNFARLAEDATWYRNAISLNQLTQLSVPAIISGLTTTEGRLPIVQDHPQNIFTLLEKQYEIRAEEPITRLCPESACGRNEIEEAPMLERWRGLAGDTSVVAGHMLLPVDLAAGLPPIDETWGDFTGAVGSVRDQSVSDASNFNLRDEFHAVIDEQDRRELVSTFIEAMEADGGRPTLDFLHALVPHSPWNYLPSGQLHDVSEGRLPSRRQENGSWVDDPWLIDQVYQLHLLQVQYVDTVLGMVLDQLHEIGTYDESLIVVMSDHGDSYRPGLPLQHDKPEIVSDVLPIPLFIKPPNQTSGGIDDYRAHTVDVIPTLADLLDIELPWASDGISLVAPDRPTRRESEVETTAGPTAYPSSATAAISRAEEKVQRFGADGPFGLAPQGHADLLGRPVESLQLLDPFQGEVILREPSRLRDVDPGADVLPITVQGRIDDADSEEIVIAIALNGQIVSVTRSYVNANGVTVFEALLPPDALQAGENDLQLIEVSGTGSSRASRPLG